MEHDLPLMHYTKSPESIMAQSMSIIEELLPLPSIPEEERRIIIRIVHATGDPELAKLVRFHPKAISSGVDAIGQGREIITDVNLVSRRINRKLYELFGCRVLCVIDETAVCQSARERGITRANAGMYYLRGHLNNSIIAIGTAPTALLGLLELMEKEDIRPALIIGMPVGFVSAASSKKELMKRDVPFITIEGTRGGSATASSTINALLDIARSKYGK